MASLYIKQSDKEWQCRICTFNNKLELATCQICGSHRNEWICSVCTFRNTSRHTQLCQICGGQQSNTEEQALNNNGSEENKQSTEVELKIQIRSIKESHSEGIHQNANIQIFKYNKYNVPIFGALFIIGTVSLILGIFNILNIFHTVIAFVGYILSITMAVALNADNVVFTKRIQILGISYVFVLIMLSLLSAKFVDISISAHITTTSLLSSSIIIIIMFFYQYGKSNEHGKTLKYLWSVKSLIIPVFVHFADIATDFGTTYEYYQRSQSQHDNIDYNALFNTSACILLGSRIAGTAIIWYYTRSRMDSILQLFDMYLIKTLNVEWKLGYKTAGRVHQYISSIESIFESGPQSIISIYILIADNNKSAIIWISSILSILSIAIRSTSQDTRFFTTKSNAKEHEWNTDNGAECNKVRCLFCNHPYLIRIIWRLIDVTSFVLICALFWHFFGGQLLTLFLFMVLILLGSHTWLRWKSSGELNVYWFNNLLATSPTSWDSVILEDRISYSFAIIRYIFSIVMLCDMNNKKPNNLLLYTNFCLTILSFTLYVWFVGRRGCYGCCHWNIGDNWVHAAVVTNLSIAGCNNKEEIMDLKNEGVEITQYLNNMLTWQIYPRPNELINIVKELNIELERRNYFLLIVWNRNLDKNMSSDEMKTVIGYLKQFWDINEEFRGKTAAEWAHLWDMDRKWINAFLEEGAHFDVQRCAKPEICWRC